MTLSANASRPLFVPPGIQVVRTGPTTRAEFERLLEFEDEGVEVTQVRPIRRFRTRRPGLLQTLAEVLRLAPRAPQPFKRSFESW